MGKHKQALNRYIIIDRFLQRKSITSKDLLGYVNEDLKANYGNEITVNTLKSDLRVMQNEFNAPIQCKAITKGIYEYSYTDKTYSFLNYFTNLEKMEMLLLLNMVKPLKILQRFSKIDEILNKVKKDLKIDALKNFVQLEQNNNIVHFYFHTIYQAIVNKKVLEIEYKPFNKPKFKSIFHPYFLKQFNNRWYVIGYVRELNYLPNYALDSRLLDVKITQVQYVNNENLNFDDFFDNIIGVTIHNDEPIQDIIIKLNPTIKDYIESKPLHNSQSIIQNEDGDYILTLNLRINVELKNVLQSFGANIQILEPLYLRNEFKKNAQSLLDNYK